MCFLRDWNFLKSSLNMVISLKVLENEISCCESCLTSSRSGNMMVGFKA